MWNPRFEAYATSSGMTPESVLERDSELFPGGRMVGFILWMSERWQTWSNLKTGSTQCHWLIVWSERDQADFDEWLAASVAEVKP